MHHPLEVPTLDRLANFGPWLVNNFATIVELAFAGAVAFAAIVGIRLNRRLVEETSHLRHAETDPFIAIYRDLYRISEAQTQFLRSSDPKLGTWAGV